MNILLTTLGRIKKKSSLYEKTTYSFPDDYCDESSFFGLSLYKWLCDEMKQPIDKVLIMGTSGSSWDALLENIDSKDDQLFYRIAGAVEDNTMNIAHYKELNGYLSEKWCTNVLCTQIPAGENTEEQHEIFSSIWKLLDSKDNIWIDLTHGYRCMPILELFIILNMEEGKNISINGIYYGMYESQNETGKKPAVELSSAKEISQWTRAIYALKHGRISALIDLPGMDEYNDELKKLVLFEEFNNVAKAKKISIEILKKLKNHNLSSFAGKLYRDKLIEYFEWSEGESYANRQFQKAENAIKNRDYSHGIVLLFESIITGSIACRDDVLKFEKREEAKNNLKLRDKNFHFLNSLRNILVHGVVQPEGKHAAEIINLLKNPEIMDKKLAELLKKFSKKI